MNTLQIRLLSLASFAVLCATLTYWFITLSGHGPEVPPVAAARTQVSVDDAAALFGGQKSGPRDVDIRLSGILSLGRRGAAAILSVNGEPGQALSAGQTFGNNMSLSEVRPHSVIVERNGAKSEIFLPTTTNGPTIYMH